MKPFARNKDPRRAGAIEVLLTKEERAELDKAADQLGISHTSVWIRMVMLRESREVSTKAGKQERRAS